jgi:hypothetical protein
LDYIIPDDYITTMNETLSKWSYTAFYFVLFF